MEIIIGKTIKVTYKNHRGETGERVIVPLKFWFGATEFHPEPQMLLDAKDVARDVERSFAVKDISSCEEID